MDSLSSFSTDELHGGVAQGRRISPPAFEATQGQNDSFFSQLPYKCYFEEVAFVGD